MRHRPVVLLLLGLVVGAVSAQSAPPATGLSDTWSAQPAHSGSASYRSTPRLGSDSSSKHFKFTDKRPQPPAPPPPADPSGKAPISGSASIGQDGRPPVDCPVNPRNPACR